jgi:DNA-binding NarL/FixJ family response regulator
MALSHGPDGFGASLLTEREQQVLDALADGLRSNEIAERLNTSVRTFSTVCVALRKKLGARNDVHAVSIAFRRGLLQTDRRTRSESAEPARTGQQ